MKAATLALALLGATALSSAALAQTPPAAPSPPPVAAPSEAAPRSASPDASNQTGTQAQSEWRDQMGRDAAPDTAAGQSKDNSDGWRSAQRDADARSRSWSQYDDEDDDDDRDADDFDDEDDDDNVTLMPGPSGAGNRMALGAERRDAGSKQRPSEGARGDAPRMTPGLMRMHMRMMGQERGARLQLKRGDSSIDIRCPTGEPVGPCVDAVVKLMDRLQAMPQNR